MKKFLSLALVLMLAISLVACGGAAGTKMTMGTGGTSGTYYGYGGVLGQYISNNTEVGVTVVSIVGSGVGVTTTYTILVGIDSCSFFVEHAQALNNIDDISNPDIIFLFKNLLSFLIIIPSNSCIIP